MEHSEGAITLVTTFSLLVFCSQSPLAVVVA